MGGSGGDGGHLNMSHLLGQVGVGAKAIATKIGSESCRVGGWEGLVGYEMLLGSGGYIHHRLKRISHHQK
jgi:hypothetical protein